MKYPRSLFLIRLFRIVTSKQYPLDGMFKLPPGCECKSNTRKTEFSCEEFDCPPFPNNHIQSESHSTPQSLGEYIQHSFRSILELKRDNSAVRGVYFDHPTTLEVANDQYIGFNLVDLKSGAVKNDVLSPGYKSGQPVVVASVDHDTITASIFSHPTSRKGGRCDWDHDPFHVKFDENSLSLCSITCNLSELEHLCETSLHGWLQPNITLFGIFSNADENETQHWGQIEKIQSNSNHTWDADLKTCLGIITTLRYDIYWTYTGALSNPQAKILHVSETQISSRALVHDTEDSESKMTFTFASTVSWIYVHGGQNPLILPPLSSLFTVPDDFFYPFGASSSFSQTTTCIPKLLIFLNLIIYFMF